MSKTQPNLTSWFPPNVKPSRVGCYQTEDDPDALDRLRHGYQWWNGKWWGIFELDKKDAALDKKSRSLFQVNYWRGLAVQP